MRRREFIGLVGGAAAWPLAVRAQPGERTPRVVFWLGGTPPDSEEGKQLSAAFRAALRGFGWVEDVNLRIELQWVKDLPTASSMRMTASFAPPCSGPFNAPIPDVTAEYMSESVAAVTRHANVDALSSWSA